jgi:hypothetical protein
MRLHATLLLSASLLTGAAIPTLVSAADSAPEGWARSLSFGLNATQARFDNWSGGGEDAIAWQSDLDGKAVRSWATTSWEWSGKISYGETKLGDSGFRKSTDEIKLGSVYTWNRGSWINPYAALNFSSQLDDGFVYEDDGMGGKRERKVSELLDPAYITESFGVGTEPRPGLKFKLGLAAKQTLSSEEYEWADDPDTATEIETLRSEFGAELIAEYEHKFNDAVALKSKLTTFWGAGPVDEIDTDWDSSLTASLTNAVKVSFNLRILRDADISRTRQLKQNLAIGIIYNIL